MILVFRLIVLFDVITKSFYCFCVVSFSYPKTKLTRNLKRGTSCGKYQFVFPLPLKITICISLDRIKYSISCLNLQAVIKAVVSVLTNEEQSLGLQQPAGIGQRPRPMCKYLLVPSHLQCSFTVVSAVDCVSMLLQFFKL
jgi:hypothetical protein